MKLYMCPVCKKKYANINDAEQCRADCLKEDYPVVMVYYCAHCDKEYSYEDDAADCVLECGPKLIEFGDDELLGKCRTCVCTGKFGSRHSPCPHICNMNIDSCADYTPDTKEFGTGIETEWRYMQQSRGEYGNS